MSRPSLLAQIFSQIEPDDGPRQIANLLLKKVSGFELPVNEKKIAKKLGIEIVLDEQMKESGKLDMYQKPARIYLKASESELQRRFTLAHELGHLFLHSHLQPVSFRDFSIPLTNQEKEANDFATHLLVPLWKLEEVISNRKIEKDSDLVELFQVPVSVLKTQLNRLS